MHEIRRFIFVILLFFAGILLILSGLSLISLSLNLLLYLGIGLVIMAIFYYLSH